MYLGINTKHFPMLENNFTGFLAQLALAKFNADIKKNEDRIRYAESAIEWEKKRQSLMSTLSVMLERAQLSRREMNFIMSNIMSTTIDGLIEKIKFVSERIPEDNPAAQFKQRQRVLSKFL